MEACHLTRRKRGENEAYRLRRRPSRHTLRHQCSSATTPWPRTSSQLDISLISAPSQVRERASARPMGRLPARFPRGLPLTPASPRAVRWPRRSLEVRRSSSPSRRPSARARRGHGHPCRRSGVPGASPGRRRARGAAIDVVPGPAGSPDSGPDRTAISCRRARVVGPDIWPMAPEEPGSRTHGGNRSRTPGARGSLVAGRARARARNTTHRPDPCRGRW